jgi:4-hydroxythreonine-4-phosphate dehydrogenase
MTPRPPIAVTMGDPAGIGPELLIKAWAARRQSTSPAFFAIADPAFLDRVARRIGVDVEIVESAPENASRVFETALPVTPLIHRVAAQPGHGDSANAPAIIESITRAVEYVQHGVAHALTTNPIAKSVLYAAGFPHPGHTEFLGELAARLYGAAVRPVMMLRAEELSVVPITIHIPLSEAPHRLTEALIIETGEIVARDLAHRFGVAQPRLAFAGLNPHAGEDGALGREEIETMAPALATLRAKGVDARGPFPADTMFHAAARATYDVALCPTHDQALIPIKTLAFDRGVNVTLGLPFVRTSPDHGTAFDIAGKGIANPTSLIEAIRLADRMIA